MLIYNPQKNSYCQMNASHRSIVFDIFCYCLIEIYKNRIVSAEVATMSCGKLSDNDSVN